MKKALEKHTSPRRGGRPSREQAGRIEENILDVAAALFFAHGFGATSIEEIAKRARISKRTFYARYKDKGEIFKAVLQRMVDRLKPPGTPQLFEGQNIEDVLRRLGQIILHAALSREAVALQRVILAEAGRFPEIAAIIGEQGARREAILHIAKLLERGTRAGEMAVDHPEFAAEQFLHMLVGAPQRRALGLGIPMTDDELRVWGDDTVALFLKGCRARR